ncbi:hypothetical protein ABH931_000079 [Streptacidiphilus sp. MAP12-33]
MIKPTQSSADIQGLENGHWVTLGKNQALPTLPGLANGASLTFQLRIHLTGYATTLKGGTTKVGIGDITWTPARGPIARLGETYAIVNSRRSDRATTPTRNKLDRKTTRARTAYAVRALDRGGGYEIRTREGLPPIRFPTVRKPVRGRPRGFVARLSTMHVLRRTPTSTSALDKDVDNDGACPNVGDEGLPPYAGCPSRPCQGQYSRPAWYMLMAAAGLHECEWSRNDW